MKRLLLACSFVLLGSIATFGACKQGQGERCQVNDDCESPLVCNKANGTCQGTGGEDLDAGVIDAVITVDAMVDAMPDAPPDAPDEP